MQRLTICLLAAIIALSALAPAAQGATTNRVAGFAVAIHDATQLALSSCVHPDADGGALFLAFIDNPSEHAAASFRVTLHDVTGELLADRTYAGLQPGDTRSLAVRLDAAPGLNGSAVCSPNS